ncbi:MAG: flagellar motor protein MotB [Bdellovibrionales bacterium]
MQTNNVFDLDDLKKKKKDIEAASQFRHQKEALRHGSADEGGEAWLISYADMMTLLVGFFVMMLSFSKIDEKKFEQMKQQASKIFGGEYKVPFEKLSDALKEKVKEQGMTDQVIFEPNETGINITFRGALFFSSGSTILKDEAKNLINNIIPVVMAQAKGFGIVIEGHTDNLAVARGSVLPSNWELSSVRACTVLRLFEAAGFDTKKLKALGWGDTHPIVPNQDPQGKDLADNQAQNRRVVIKILKHFEE